MAENKEHKEHKATETKPKLVKEEPKVVPTAVVSNPISSVDNKEKTEEKKEVKKEKVEKVQKVKKEEAIAIGSNLPASKKHCMYICSFIKNKPVNQAIAEMQEVILFKRVIPMKGEIPHRSAPGIMSGRYPINAAKQFVYLLKALKGNIIANGLDLDKSRISFASATWDSRPGRKGGTRFKRAHVLLKAKEFNNQNKEKKN